MSDAEDTVRLVVANFEPLYRELGHAVHRIAWFDEEDRTWNDVDAAAAHLKSYVTAVDPTAPGLTDLGDVDLGTVDFAEIIRDELGQANLDEGREFDEGL